MRAWLTAQKERHPPKSPIAAAIRYAENQWEELGVFLDDVRVPLDNNGSERALRRVALGRKNYLFVHDSDAGASIAGLYSLVATCEARAIIPSNTSPTCLPACRITRLPPSTNCCPARGPSRAAKTDASSRRSSPDGTDHPAVAIGELLPAAWAATRSEG
jgi:transposase